MKERVFKILQQVMGENGVIDSDDYLSDGLLDSLGVIEIVERLEKEFDISIKGNDIVADAFINMESICELVLKNM